MKVKARDLVAGWPRGRSTGTFIDTRDLLEFCRWRWTNTKCPEIPLLLADLEQSVAYHEGQQRMVDAFFAAWRTLPPASLVRYSYFPSELKTFPIFRETLEEMTLEEAMSRHEHRLTFRLVNC